MNVTPHEPEYIIMGFPASLFSHWDVKDCDGAFLKNGGLSATSYCAMNAVSQLLDKYSYKRNRNIQGYDLGMRFNTMA